MISSDDESDQEQQPCSQKPSPPEPSVVAQPTQYQDPLPTQDSYSSSDDDGNVEFDEELAAQMDPFFQPGHHFGNPNRFESNVGFHYTQEQKSIVDLMQVIHHINAPDSAFKMILEWAQRSSEAGFNFIPTRGGVQFNSHFPMISDLAHRTDAQLPKLRPVLLSHDEISEVVTFDFKGCALNLLQDRSVMKKQNLCLDWENPLAPYEPPKNRLGEALSGKVCRENRARFITDPTKQLFCPIICWFDRTSITGNSRFSLAPFMVTFGIFTEEFRRHLEAWFVLGYMPKPQGSSAEKVKNETGRSMRDYHLQLKELLKSYKDTEAIIRDVVLPIGPEGEKLLDVICPILYIIQDMEEGDRLCGLFGGHLAAKQRHCRACNVSFKHLDEHRKSKFECTFAEAAHMRDIARSHNEERRKKHSMHWLDNAFYELPFVDQIRGIFGATPSEVLHCLRKGVIEWCNQLCMGKLTTTRKTEIDRLGRLLTNKTRQTAKQAYPKTSFANPSQVTMCSAKEHVGLLFLFVIISHYDDGWKFLNSQLDLKSNGEVTLIHIMELFEALLCFEKWLCQPQQWDLEEEARAMADGQKSIRKLMKMCKERLPRLEGNGWKRPKFHELLHLITDMQRYGSAINFMAERPESLLKDTGKRVGRKAQKRKDGSIYELQSASRFANMTMVSSVHAKMFHPEMYNNNPEYDVESDSDSGEEDEVVTESSGRAAFGSVTKNGDGSISVSWLTKSKASAESWSLLEGLPQYLIEKFGDNVDICTEYKRDDNTFRCHPNFMNGGPWYDWLRVGFENQRTKQVRNFPCKLVAVVVENKKTSNAKYTMVLQCAQDTTERSSVLFTEWTWAPRFEVAPAASIHSQCFVIPIGNDKKNNKPLIIEALPVEEWAGKFTSVFQD